MRSHGNVLESKWNIGLFILMNSKGFVAKAIILFGTSGYVVGNC